MMPKLSRFFCKFWCLVIFLVMLVQQLLILNLPISTWSSASGKYIRDKSSSQSSKTPGPGGLNSEVPHLGQQHNFTRVAIVVPYLGSSLPAWFDTFLFSSQISSSLYDWLIFVNDAPIRVLPSNVKMIRMSSMEFYERLALLDENPPDDIVGQMAEYLRLLLMKQSYILVEFKPCLGFIFADYLKHYSHWAFADLDVLLGRIDSLITADMLTSYDIVTTSFGDTYRMYMRGQFTIHKNIPLVNNIWRRCNHLSGIGARIKKFVDSDLKDWNFQSAEGCYSKAVSLTNDISYYVSNTQISDAFGAPLNQKESFMIGSSIMRCYEPLLLTDLNDFKTIAMGRGNALQQQIDADYHSLSFRSYHCAYWVSPAYEVCLDFLPSYADVISENKELSYFVDSRYEIFDGKCKEGVISHFQGWKRNFFAATTSHPPLDSHVLLITETGFIPFRITELGNDLSFGNTLQLSNIPGRLSITDLQSHLLWTKKHSTFGIMNSLFEFPTSKVSKLLGRPDIASSYCAGFSYDTKKCTCSVFGDNINIVAVNEKSFVHVPGGITLIIAAWEETFYSGTLDTLLNGWNDLKIIVLARSKNSGQQKRRRVHWSDITIIVVDISHCRTFVNTEESNLEQQLYLPDNMLFNIGLDITSTDLVCVVPSGITFRSYNTSDKISETVTSLSQKLSSELIAKVTSYSGDPVALVLPIYTALQSPDELKTIQEMESRSKAQGNNYISPGEDALLINLREVIHHDFELNNIDHLAKDLGQRSISSIKSDQDRRLTQFRSSIDLRSSGWYNYPNIKYSCGRDHSKNLLIPFKERLAVGPLKLTTAIKFNAMEFLKERSMLYPVVFNTSSSHHGSNFVRFPEELSGPGCYGLSILRILAGSGYTLHWSEEIFAGENDQRGFPTKGTKSSCACSHGGDPNVLRDTSAKLNNYYQRAVQLRSTGLEGIYSHAPFGKIFEDEQREKIAEAE